MPNWNEVLREIQEENNALDTVRRRYLGQIEKITGRNAIAYYSGWLQKGLVSGVEVNDKDKSGFMLTINKLDRERGLDLILHTPGGDIPATESLVDYLHFMFGKNIRIIVPQISMSAGTMIAFSAKQIVMGKHSNLGPIDPQHGGLACQAILDEFEQAKKDIKKNPHSVALWQVIIGKYNPTLLRLCEQAIEWSKEMARKWLEDNMCSDNPEKVEAILDMFSDHKKQKTHNRHISKKECEEVGLEVISLEDNQELQDAVLTTHHAFMHTFDSTYCVKIIENHNGIAYVSQASPRQPRP